MNSLPTPDNLADFGKALFAAVTAHQYWLLASLVLVGLVWALRKYLAPKVPFLASDAGGALLSFLVAFASGLGVALMGGTPMSAALALTVFVAAFKVSGGWALLMHLLDPLLTKWGLHFDAAATQATAAQAGSTAAAAAPPVDPAAVVNGDGK
jgi:hypothetical protein